MTQRDVVYHWGDVVTKAFFLQNQHSGLLVKEKKMAEQNFTKVTFSKVDAQTEFNDAVNLASRDAP
jgi:hypothetical protein